MGRHEAVLLRWEHKTNVNTMNVQVVTSTEYGGGGAEGAEERDRRGGETEGRGNGGDWMDSIYRSIGRSASGRGIPLNSFV